MIVATQSSSACLAKIFLEFANRGLPHEVGKIKGFFAFYVT